MLSLLLKWIKEEESKYLIAVACLIEIEPLTIQTHFLVNLLLEPVNLTEDLHFLKRKFGDYIEQQSNIRVVV